MTNSTAPATPRDRFTPTRPEEESAVLEARLADWERDHAPEAGYQEWVLARVVLATVRLDRNTSHEAAVRSYEAARADLCWDDDRRLEAEDLGATIHKNPARVRRRLEATPQGADWLIERWDALGRIAGSGRAWSEPQGALALDMLGTPPALRDGPPPFDPDPAAQAAFALAERQRLESLRERVLVPRDEHKRALAASGVSIDESPAMVRVRREESFWTREYHRALSEFRRACPRPAESPAPEPEPEPDRSASPPVDLADYDRTIMAQLMQARHERGVEDPFEAVDFSPSAAAATPQGNRHARRAQEARLRSQR